MCIWIYLPLTLNSFASISETKSNLITQWRIFIFSFILQAKNFLTNFQNLIHRIEIFFHYCIDLKSLKFFTNFSTCSYTIVVFTIENYILLLHNSKIFHHISPIIFENNNDISLKLILELTVCFSFPGKLTEIEVKSEAKWYQQVTMWCIYKASLHHSRRGKYWLYTGFILNTQRGHWIFI